MVPRPRRLAADLTYLLAAIPLGTLWLCLLIVGWTVSVSLFPILVGFPLLLATLIAIGWAADLERTVAHVLLGTSPPEPRPPTPPAAFSTRLWRAVRNGRVWVEQAFLLLRFAVGMPLAIVAVTAVAVVLGLIAMPLWGWSLPRGADVGIWRADTVLQQCAFVPVGLLLAVPCAWTVRGLGLASRWLCTSTLGRYDGRTAVGAPGGDGDGVTVPDAPAANGLVPAGEPATATASSVPTVSPVADPAAAAPTVSPAADPAALAARSAARQTRVAQVIVVTGLLSAVAFGVSLLVWALGGAGYFWPIWVLVGLGIPLALAVALLRLQSVEEPGLRRFLVHAAVSAAIVLFCLALWLGTRHAGTGPWPAWVAAGLLAALGVHAVFVFGRHQGLERRVEQLTRTRAGAVDVQASELARIERDLHDGAQARLVAMTMSLGLAREHMDDDPAKARALVDEAQEHARLAVGELRDLSRGIAPPILMDRGLEAAVVALVGRGPVPVQVVSELPLRPPAAAERAAYFVVAEAVANAAKHSEATSVTVLLRQEPGTLVVTVSDDGRGGADAGGSGLRGLRQRVEALDGTLAVTSPAGGPTTVQARFPCAS